MDCYPLKTEPGCLVMHIALVSSVRLSEPGQGITALKNSIVLRYHFDIYHIPYEAKSVKHRKMCIHVI